MSETKNTQKNTQQPAANDEKNFEKYLKIAKELGAEKASLIDVKTITTAAWTIFKCQYGCDFYGKSHCCPPKAPGYLQTREMLKDYGKAILFTCHKDGGIKEIARETSRMIFLDGYYKTIAFGAGPCLICKTCNPAHCSFPKKALPSMEACGIDVFTTARANGYEIHTVIEKTEEKNYFGLVLID